MAPRLGTTSYAVLGLLTFGERSGYDLMKLAEQSIGHFWSPTKSHLYGELKRLASDKLVTERHVHQKDRPDKRLYAITDAGRSALKDWLENAEVAPEQVKSEFTLRVFFGDLVGHETLLAQVEEMRRHAQAELEQLQLIEKAIRDDRDLFYPYLTLKAGLGITRAKLRWAGDAIEALRNREDS